MSWTNNSEEDRIYRTVCQVLVEIMDSLIDERCRMETDICSMIGLLAYKQHELRDLLTEISLAEDAERKGQVVKDIEENIEMLRRREEELHVQRADVRLHCTVCSSFLTR